MRKIKDIVQKPSDAVDAMIKGLIRQSKRKGFKIQMQSYGGYSAEEQVCFGCAATCTLQEIAGKNLTRSYMVGYNLRLEELELVDDSSAYDEFDFEMSIDRLRTGKPEMLLRFFEVDVDLRDQILWSPEAKSLPRMTTGDWKEHLSSYRKFSKYLKKLGL